MRYLMTLVFTLLLAMPASAAFMDGGRSQGGFAGPDGMSATTVEKAKKMRDDAHIVLTGYIVSRIGGEKYVFRDNSGDITVEIDDKDFRGQTVTPQNLVRIIGEVDKSFGRDVEIDVDRLEVLQ